ncbi:hypothetical protein EZV62_000869 [Acer yangbiense]|uniref:WAT1-related protein n=1 Tax=Acer yangbiense TaxID=1000413 RepID=A0A5C7ISI7_9ROSI|nr:hypothetical protein EZV62_000869 [Acer yangbiense]
MKDKVFLVLVEKRSPAAMAVVKASSFSGMYTKFKPHLLMFLAQIGYTFLYFITEASFNHGMNPHVYVTYRHIVSAIVMFPFAYFLERKRTKIRPKLTFALFMEISLLSFLGVSSTLNMYFASHLQHLLHQRSTPLETLDLRHARGMAKVIGTVVSLAGVTTMTLYKGPILKNLCHPLIHLQRTIAIHEHWLKGSILTVGDNIEAISSVTFTDNMDELSWGSAIGYLHWAVIVIVGLYMLLWGKEADQEVDSETEGHSCSSCDEEKGPKTNNSDEKGSTRAIEMPCR